MKFHSLAFLTITAIGAAIASPIMAQGMQAMPQAAMAQDDSVYQAFGGQPGVDKVIDDFIAVWKADPRISHALDHANVPHLAAMLKLQIGQLTGGPVKYTGEDMKTAHRGMGLRDADFNALAEDLQVAMDKNHVPFRAQNKLLAKLAPMERDIVTHR
ncbi:MAG: group 1 truncated hemoglobin [Burkholderiales bacterium]|nr:group 1 truncated hemoglobin [Burkholderiales bacterium]MDE2608774.1 group 1 truncated hemoglobin [Burkholderiales bacterium]